MNITHHHSHFHSNYRKICFLCSKKKKKHSYESYYKNITDKVLTVRVLVIFLQVFCRKAMTLLKKYIFGKDLHT